MKFFTAIVAAACSAVAVADTFTVESFPDFSGPFGLHVSSSAPSYLQKLGLATLDQSGNLGFFTNGTAFSAQFSGKSIYSTSDASDQLLLAPTNTSDTAVYKALVGTASSDAVIKEFNTAGVLGNGDSEAEYFIGANSQVSNWTACGSSGAYALYFGWKAGLSGCTAAPFSLQIQFSS